MVHRFRAAPPGGRTVFLVHPGALAAEVYRDLGAALPEGAGLTVLDLGGLPQYWEAALTGGRAPTTVEELAGHLLQVLDGVHDGGPYTLAGWSFGGVLAHAMIELMPDDRRPERLLLLDSIAPVGGYKQPDEALDPPLLLRWFGMYLGAKRSVRVPLDTGALEGCDTDAGILQVLDAGIASGALRPETPVAGLRKLYDTYVDGLLRNNRLTAPYQPARARRPLVLLKAESGLIPGDQALGWAPLAARGLEVRQCPGDHYTMLTHPDSVATIAWLSHSSVHPV